MGNDGQALRWPRHTGMPQCNRRIERNQYAIPQRAVTDRSLARLSVHPMSVPHDLKWPRETMIAGCMMCHAVHRQKRGKPPPFLRGPRMPLARMIQNQARGPRKGSASQGLRRATEHGEPDWSREPKRMPQGRGRTTAGHATPCGPNPGHPPRARARDARASGRVPRGAGTKRPRAVSAPRKTPQSSDGVGA